LQSAAPNSTILSTQSTIDQVMDELFTMNEDINESFMEIANGSITWLPDLAARCWLPAASDENSTFC
jgi:hypothetical protein